MAEASGASTGHSGLFGRSMLYVAVWATPLVSSSIVSPVLTHLLPPSEFGQLSTALAIFQVLLVLAVGGLDEALVLARADAGSDRPARSLVTVGLVLTTTITFVAVVTAPVWSGQLGFSGAVVVAVVAWTLPAGVVAVTSMLLLSQDRLGAFTLVVAGSGVGAQVVGLALLVVVGDNSATTYALGYLAVFLTAAIVGLALVRPRWGGPWDPGLVRRAFALGIPLTFGNLASFVLDAGDRLVVQRLMGPEQAGRYQIAYIVGEAAVAVLHMTSNAWAPQVVAVRDPAARRALLARARDGLLDLMSPAVLGVTLGAPFVLGLVAPPSYHPQALIRVVFLVLLAGYPILVAGTWVRALVATKRSRPIAVSTTVAAVVNIGLNFLLVPYLDLEGAGVATLIAYTLRALVLWLALAKDPRWPPPPIRLILLNVAVVAVSAATLLLPDTTVWTLGRFLLAVACLPWFFLRLHSLRSSDLVPHHQSTSTD
jgi:O-antigen/teichoic acid export membrane protein